MSKNMLKSVAAIAKVTLVFLNIWVIAVVLVVSLGRWRVFESNYPSSQFRNSHLIVMRELKEEVKTKNGLPSNSSIARHSMVLPQRYRHQLTIYGPSDDTTLSPVPDSRVTILRHWCQQQHPHRIAYDQIPRNELTPILVNERYKLLFCQIPGVAINDWRKIFLVLNGVVNASRTSAISGGDVFGKYSLNISRLSDYPDSQRGEMLKSYYKVIFVRDPLERLVIAYRGKMLSRRSKYFHRTYGSLIIRRYRKNASLAEINDGTDVNFSEFVKFIIDNEHSGKEALNEHWEQYYKQCHPCLLDYDFVGAFENVEKDTEVVLRKLGATKILKPPYMSDTKVLKQTDLARIYSQISARELNLLFKVYSADYTLFGYQCPEFVHSLLKKEKILHDY